MRILNVAVNYYSSAEISLKVSMKRFWRKTYRRRWQPRCWPWPLRWCRGWWSTHMYHCPEMWLVGYWGCRRPGQGKSVSSELRPQPGRTEEQYWFEIPLTGIKKKMTKKKEKLVVGILFNPHSFSVLQVQCQCWAAEGWWLKHSLGHRR